MTSKNKLIPRDAKSRAKGLLDMLYSPPELAEELGINKRLVYEKLIPAGMPHTRDEKDHIWLHGPAVISWIHSLRPERRHMNENEVYCLGCRAVVPLVGPRRVVQGRLTLLKAVCTRCGAKVNRSIKQP